MRRRRFLPLVPPFLAGAAAGIAAEVSAGLLLYSAEGFLPALTLILTVEAASAGLGLWSGVVPLGRGAVEEVRRRWLLVLVAFAGGAVFAGGWLFLGPQGRSPLSQGLGLALLGSFPLFAVGSLLGAMSLREEGVGAPAEVVGVPAVLGLATGFLLTGWILFPGLAPHSIYLLCLMGLSMGALLQGRILDYRPVVEVRERVLTPLGELRVEDRAVGSPRREVRVLLEDERVRGAERQDGSPARGWEGAVLAALDAMEGELEPVLFLGGGSGTLVHILSRRFPGSRILVGERNPALPELARRHLGGEGEGAELRFGDPAEILLGLEEPFSLILVDGSALPLEGTLPYLREGDWASLAARCGAGGRVVLGGMAVRQGEESPTLEVLLARGGALFSGAYLYLGEEDASFVRVAWGRDGWREAFLLFTGREAPPWPSVLPGFRLRSSRAR